MQVEASRAAVAREEPLRILMVLESEFTKSGGGGAESQLRTLSLHLRRLGHRVTVVMPMLPYGPQLSSQRFHGIPVGRVRYPKRKLIGAALLGLRFAGFLVRHRDRYDAWHVHIGHNMGAVACLVGSLVGKPVVVKISGWWELEQGLLQPKLSPMSRLFSRWLKRATAVQAISTRIAGELVRRGFPQEKILVLPNAVDTARFAARTGVRKKGEPFVGVFVGRLVPEKGLSTLLDGWAQAFAGRDDVKLRLVGEGVEAEPLRAQAAKLGIAHQLELLGHRDRVEEVLAQAHVGVLPSRIEGLSNTLLEFMACGLPVLASKVSGSEDFVLTGKNGWLFPVGDAAALATSLKHAEALPPAELARLGAEARATVENLASLDRVVGRLLLLYRGAAPRELEKAR
jgi:glycosyltransferase involved in cell wall biosynthesis